MGTHVYNSLTVLSCVRSTFMSRQVIVFYAKILGGRWHAYTAESRGFAIRDNCFNATIVVILAHSVPRADHAAIPIPGIGLRYLSIRTSPQPYHIQAPVDSEGLDYTYFWLESISVPWAASRLSEARIGAHLETGATY